MDGHTIELPSIRHLFHVSVPQNGKMIDAKSARGVWLASKELPVKYLASGFSPRENNDIALSGVHIVKRSAIANAYWLIAGYYECETNGLGRVVYLINQHLRLTER